MLLRNGLRRRAKPRTADGTGDQPVADELKGCIRLLFWSGQSFDEPGLTPEGKFKAAEARYTDADEIDSNDIERWLARSIEIQWDYKNIVKRKGKLVRLKPPD